MRPVSFSDCISALVTCRCTRSGDIGDARCTFRQVSLRELQASFLSFSSSVILTLGAEEVQLTDVSGDNTAVPEGGFKVASDSFEGVCAISGSGTVAQAVTQFLPPVGDVLLRPKLSVVTPATKTVQCPGALNAAPKSSSGSRATRMKVVRPATKSRLAWLLNS